MTARNQPHKYRCETCKNPDCPFGVEAKYCVRIIPNIMHKVGCASHSDVGKAEQHDRLKCPKCNGPVFIANIDDVDTFLCYDDTCKWKQKIAAEPAERRIADVIAELEKRESEAECGLTLTDYHKVVSMLHELALLREKGE